MVRQKFRGGFTLIELSISITFVSVLSLMIVLIISNTVESYQRGVTLSSINTVGMDLVDDMRFAVQNSPMKSIKQKCEIYSNQSEELECKDDGGYGLAFVVKNKTIKIENEEKEVPIYGAFCTGMYTYIWNSGYFWSDETKDQLTGVGPAKFTYRTSDSEETQEEENFRLLKIRDESRAVCAISVGWGSEESKYNTNNLSSDFSIGENNYLSALEKPTDLLLDSDNKNNNLALYDLYVSRPAEGTVDNNVFYSVSFILGTIRGGIDITANGKKCVAPSEVSGEYFDYCAVNKFNFAVQANGG